MPETMHSTSEWGSRLTFALLTCMVCAAEGLDLETVSLAFLFGMDASVSVWFAEDSVRFASRFSGGVDCGAVDIVGYKHSG